MKKIECVIRPEKLKEVSESLRMLGIGGITATEVKGFGRETTRPDNYIFLPKTKIEIYAVDAQVDEITHVIIKCCREGKLGAGKIVIIPIEECVRVRTQERGEKAIL